MRRAYAAVRLPRAAGSRQDRLVIVTGVSPTVEERSRMSLVAAELTLSASVQAADEAATPGRIALDTTGMFGPTTTRDGAEA